MSHFAHFEASIEYRNMSEELDRFEADGFQ